jgi:hypothetical protein
MNNTNPAIQDDPIAAFRKAGDAAAEKTTGSGAAAQETRIDFTAIVNGQQQLTQAIQRLTEQLIKAFPQATGTSGSATGGAATLPANPVGFIVSTIPGTSTVVKIPYYT